MLEVSVVNEEIGIQERRKFPRVKAVVHVEFQPEGSVSVTHAETSDLSCRGCFVGMNVPFLVGTKLRTTLWLDEKPLTTAPVVATHHPHFGNGIRFIDMSVQDINRLNQFLHSALR